MIIREIVTRFRLTPRPVEFITLGNFSFKKKKKEIVFGLEALNIGLHLYDLKRCCIS